MARIRTIKPEFFTSEQVAECSPSARLLFVGLWCFCDDGGVHPASCKRLKMEIMPGDECSLDDIAGWINELKANGLLVEFRANNQRFWHVTGWKHQRVDKPNFKYPSPSDPGSVVEGSTSGRGTVDDHSPPEGKGVEGKGVEKSTTLSGSPPGQPDDAPPTKGKSNGTALRRQALEVLGFLNEKAGKRFEATDANLDFIKGRLREGRDVQTLRMVIAMKCREWKDDEHMRQYLRPATLFNKSKCAQYVGELGSGRRDHG